MSSLGFSAEAIGGSAVRFRSEKWGSMNIHRPHPGDRIEGFAAMKLRGRLERRFGWGVETFVSDKSEGSVPAKESNSNRKRKGKGKKR